jgi:hypothetical protein
MKNQGELIARLIKQQGNLLTAAATLQIHETTLWRWRTGKATVHGVAEVAVLAVLEHPEDYAHFLKQARPQGRPQTKENEE